MLKFFSVGIFSVLLLGVDLAFAGQNDQDTPERSRTSLSQTEQAISAAVEASIADEISFLEKVVNINSGTMNHEGVKKVGNEFAREFAAIGFETEWEALPAEMNRAGHMLAKRKGDRGNKLLLIGHLDTVFPTESSFQKFRRDGEVIWGPGIADMKGGDVVVLYALRALQQVGALEGAQINIIFTGEEELTGKPVSASRKSLIDLAKASDIALNFEGGKDGEAVMSRRGASGWRLTVTGRRRHSSGIFSENVGAGAVFETSRILNAFYEELSAEEFLTFNPGVIVGGTDISYNKEDNHGSAFGKTNVVAQEVVVDGGLRFISEEQKENARKRMREIVARNLPHTDAVIEFTDSYPAMAPTKGNMKLLALYSAMSEALGFGVVEGNDPAKRGAADISFAAPYVAASMDGLGVHGGGSHTPEEYMEAASFKEATLRAAILIHRLTKEDAQDF